MEISDRPTTLPITHDPNLSDKVMCLQMAFKQRPLRDGGGKPSLGRLAPWTRPLSKAAALGDKLQELLSLGDGSHPFPEDLLKDIREILVPASADHFSELIRREEVPMGPSHQGRGSSALWLQYGGSLPQAP